MKFVIFADRSHNYIKPIADGLVKMLQGKGQVCSIYYDGIYWLCKPNLFYVLLKDAYRLLMNIKERRKNLYLYRFWQLLFFMNRKRSSELNHCDCIIIVNNCPDAFYKDNLTRMEVLRSKYNKPIVLYDLHYLPNQGWYNRLKRKDKNNFGLERYDWYLPGSIVTEFALPREIPKIYSQIGFDLRAANLYPEQTEFMALIDFKRPEAQAELAIQIQALKETNTPYIELNARYTSDEIRAIYRKCSIYFVATRESFCLPVIETQLCGCTIFTPYKEWLPAHSLNKTVYDAGVGVLGKNFYVYDNSVEKLKSMINNLKSHFNGKQNIKNFETDYPTYYSGNDKELSLFIQKLENKEINTDKHKQFLPYNEYISKTDELHLSEDE